MNTNRCTGLGIWATLVALAVLSAPVLAGSRVALVIGNASYAHAPLLANPVNDASDVGAALGRLGFSVTRLEDADYATLRRGLQEFTRTASGSELALVFYAGHGIEVDQRNYLVPVDARLASDQDVEFETVPLELVLRSVERSSGLALVILDACRENPFAASMRRAGARRSIGRGLARVEPSGSTLVAYAAKGGTVASDGSGRNSPYTEALLAHLEEPSVEVMYMFRKVRDAVLSSTGRRQEPFVYGSLSSEEVYLGAAGAASPAPSVEPAPAIDSGATRITAERLALERVFWESVKDSDDPADIEAYRNKFPDGMFDALALNRLERLGALATPPTRPEQVAPAEPIPEPSSLEHRIPDPASLSIPAGNQWGYPGVGKFAGHDASRYEGEFFDHNPHGRGTYTWADGSRYKGRFRAGELHGRGTYTFPDGRAWTCEWRENAVVTGSCDHDLAAARTWKARDRLWAIEMKMPEGYVDAIVNHPTGATRLRCRGAVGTAGDIDLKCVPERGYAVGTLQLVGTFPDLELRDDSPYYGGASFSFELDTESQGSD